MPKVSVVTGYYNRSRWLEGTIRSILGQTFRDLELLVFDDASTDDSAAELDRLSGVIDDQRFRYVIHEQNKGFTRGLVDAITSTTGDYIAIQGSGDISYPARIERQASLLSARDEVGAVGCWVVETSETGKVLSTFRPDAANVGVGAPFSHGELMMRRSVYELAGGYRTEFRNAQDLDLYARLKRLSEFATVPETLYERRALTDGMSFSPEKVAVQSRYGIIARRMADLSDTAQREVLRRIREEGIEALVPAEDPELQERYRMRAYRIALWGNVDAARAMAEHVTDGRTRRRLIRQFRLYGSWIGWPLRKLAPTAIALRRSLRRRLNRA